jgi:hypothetical protein
VKKFISVVLLVMAAVTIQAQVNTTTALLGSWSGKLKVGAMSLTLVLHLEQADGYVKVSLDSPDQGAKGIPTFKEYLSDDSLAVKVESITLLAAQANRILSLSGQPANMTVEKYRQQEAVQQVPWVGWFCDYDPSDDIRKTPCPVFALNGNLDCQVLSSLNLEAIRCLLPSSKRHLIKEYPSLNHLFQHCTTGLPTEYGQIEETISPEVLEDIARWIQSL